MTRTFALTFSVILHALLIVLAVYGLPFFAKDREISTRLVVVEVMTIAETTNAPPPSETATPSEMPAETASAADVPDRPVPPPPPPPPSTRPEPPAPAPPTPSVSTPPTPAEPAPPPPPDVAQPQTPPPAATPPETVASAPPPEVAPATEAQPVPIPEPTIPEPAIPEAPKPEVVQPEAVEAPAPEVAEAQPADLPPVPTLRPTPPPRRQAAQPPEPPKKPEPEDPFASILNTVADFEKKPRPTQAEPQPQQAAANTQRQLAPSNADRPLSVSELDAIRQQISGCWLVPAGAKNAEELVVEIRVRMRPDRTVSNTEILDMSRMAEPHFRAAAEAAVRALRNPRCSPLNLPLDKYETWKSFVITFNPRDMLS
jgi:hypothetical protein